MEQLWTVVLLLTITITTTSQGRMNIGHRIVGGKLADITEAPHTVSLSISTFLNQQKFVPWCGGTLIRADVVLTAAHCFTNGMSPSYWKVRAGSPYVNRGGVVAYVDEVVVHKKFSKDRFDYDIALLFLKSSFPVDGETIATIPYATDSEPPEEGTAALVTGWGKTQENGKNSDHLMKITLPVVDSDTCTELMSDTLRVTPRMLCAGWAEGGRDACQGDSGGPLVARGRVAGVTSWGVGCARPQRVGVYTNVGALSNWVRSHTRRRPRAPVERALQRAPRGLVLESEQSVTMH